MKKNARIKTESNVGWDPIKKVGQVHSIYSDEMEDRSKAGRKPVNLRMLKIGRIQTGRGSVR